MWKAKAIWWEGKMYNTNTSAADNILMEWKEW